MFPSLKIFTFLTFFAYNIFILINFGVAEDCPSEPCLEDKPQLGESDKLEIEFFYDQYAEGSEAVANLYSYICDAMKNFKGLVKMKLRPGALISEENGEIQCGEDYCEGDRAQACQIKVEKKYETSCDYPPINEEKLNECVANNEGDDTLKKNGKRRRDLNIPDCKLPAVTFNEKYDLCANFQSYADFEAYICELYDNKVPPCCPEE